ncbi:unnamed protein product [Gulo gulo]|uniref:Uncharacterized protein n=1 Tax=Gulo gulo TaxID=48420 RepID=A0A9X9LT65_GULGU|nr:unnamed protein product [Gulo gulo]
MKGSLMVAWWFGLIFLEHSSEGTPPACRVAVFWATRRWKRWTFYSGLMELQCLRSSCLTCLQILP